MLICSCGSNAAKGQIKYRLNGTIRTEVVSLKWFILHVVKVRKPYSITKPWLEKVGALREKRCAYFDAPSSARRWSI